MLNKALKTLRQAHLYGRTWHHTPHSQKRVVGKSCKTFSDAIGSSPSLVAAIINSRNNRRVNLRQLVRAIQSAPHVELVLTSDGWRVQTRSVMDVEPYGDFR